MEATKNIRNMIGTLAYGFDQADENVTPNKKTSNQELRRYAEMLGTTGQSPEVALKAVLDYAQDKLAKSKTASVAREDLRKILGECMADIARAAGSAAGKGNKDGDMLSAAEYATLPAHLKAVVDAAIEFGTEKPYDVFFKVAF